MKQLVIGWQRLLDDHGRTCPRCVYTEREVEAATAELARLLVSSGVSVSLVKHSVDLGSFQEEPLLSNRILIAGKELEAWLGASTGSSPCCDVCGRSECRTIEYAGDTHEAVPAQMIVRAGLAAARELFGVKAPTQAGERIPVLRLKGPKS